MPKLEKNFAGSHGNDDFPDDSELQSKFDLLYFNQKSKENYRRRLRYALWAIEAMLKEKMINTETTADEFLQIIEDRKMELYNTKASSEELLNKPAALDDLDGELYHVAEEEHGRSDRLLDYLGAAGIVISDLMENRMLISSSPIISVHDLIKEMVNNEEEKINQDERDRRKK